MKISIPIVSSITLHLTLLLVIFIVGFQDGPLENVVDTVRIRIRSSNLENTASAQVRPKGSSPQDVARENREPAILPRFNDSVPPQTIPAISRTAGAGIETSALDVESPDVSSAIMGLSRPDPLAGVNAEIQQSPEPKAGVGQWDMFWENGEKRGILSFPMINGDDFPDISERLTNLSIEISVSPEGEVISAVVRPPGSGDIRIDRRMNALALQLIFEPLFEGRGVQSGTLRLVFTEGES
ncbi:MAG: hypothetical protein RQ801_03715 [Spirochaetaceae bacterium]|nr:hypothetical protein [Spirochaetaceae bacterium]MDT8297386.1 hypothetical protein [Spirochaetaceae bacterium]